MKITEEIRAKYGEGASLAWRKSPASLLNVAARCIYDAAGHRGRWRGPAWPLSGLAGVARWGAYCFVQIQARSGSRYQSLTQNVGRWKEVST
jgi:hypothetical protein